MSNDSVILAGRRVRLEPLSRARVAGLVAAAAEDPALCAWTPLPSEEASVGEESQSAAG